MCLPIDCWLCMPRPVDDDPAPASRTQPAHRNGNVNGSHYTGNGGQQYTGTGNGNGGLHYNGNGNGAHHYNGNGYTAHRPEADRKASNDVKRGTVNAAATGAKEKAAAYPYVAGADGTLKQQPAAASNGRVAADGGHGARGGAPHNYYERAPAHRQDAADSNYYPAATATADHERY